MKRIFFVLAICLSVIYLCAYAETDVFGVSERLSGMGRTIDHGYCVQHIYSGNYEHMKKEAEACIQSILEISGIEQIVYPVNNLQSGEAGQYVYAFLSPENPQWQGLSMVDFGIEHCHIFVLCTFSPDSDYNYVNLIHSADIPCIEEPDAGNALKDAEAAQPIEWLQMGLSGESFYYGETETDGDPEGFIVYESNQNCTYYGVNFGGEKDDLWDGTVIAVNRDGDKVDSINLITYRNGEALYSTRYFEDGSIIYCVFENNIPDVRFDRDGEKLYRRYFVQRSSVWGIMNKVGFDEIQPEWGLGYRDVEIHYTEKCREDGLHIGRYLLTGVTDEGEVADILYLTAFEDGSVEYTLNGETWRYDKAHNAYGNISE